LLASGGEGEKVKLWDIPSGNLRDEIEVRGTVLGLAFNPAGNRLIVGTRNEGIVLFDVTTGHQLWEVSAHGIGARGVAFSPDGQYVYWASSDESVCNPYGLVL